MHAGSVQSTDRIKLDCGYCIDIVVEQTDVLN